MAEHSYLQSDYRGCGTGRVHSSAVQAAGRDGCTEAPCRLQDGTGGVVGRRSPDERKGAAC